MDSKFKLIDKKSTTAKQLLEMLEKDGVILKISLCEDKKCYVESYALIKNQVYVYSPRHCLMESEGTRSSMAYAESYEEFRDIFEKKGSFIDIYDEEYEESYYEQPIEQCASLLKSKYNVYVAYDKGNFYGPLECEFMEKFLKENKEYYLDL